MEGELSEAVNTQILMKIRKKGEAAGREWDHLTDDGIAN